MDVEIVDFPETPVAAIEHEGPPGTEERSVKKLIAWRLENGYPPSAEHRNYGLHYNDPAAVPAEQYRVDLCLSVNDDIAANPYGVISKIIPACRCARARYIGPRDYIPVAKYLVETWLPRSGERASGLPAIFHYVNVGPGIEPQEMITDVYLPLA